MQSVTIDTLYWQWCSSSRWELGKPYARWMATSYNQLSYYDLAKLRRLNKELRRACIYFDFSYKLFKKALHYSEFSLRM